MKNLLLYLTTILVWGSTWLAIQYQLGVVPETWSITYRFGLAGLLLMAYCLATRKPMRYSHSQHLLMVAQGVLLFSGNYILFYIGSVYLISGIVAVIFAFTLVMNIINARLFLKTPLSLKICIGALLGFAGLTEVFWSEIKSLAQTQEQTYAMLFGLGLCLIATFIASLGNIIAKHNQKQLPILQSNAYSMLYGAIFTGLLALCWHHPMVFDFSVSYVGSLLYLAIFGSIIAFGAYLTLLGRIGPERAAYAFVVLPIIAMLLSTYYESFAWSAPTLIGIALIVVGNMLMLGKKRKIKFSKKRT